MMVIMIVIVIVIVIVLILIFIFNLILILILTLTLTLTFALMLTLTLTSSSASFSSFPFFFFFFFYFFLFFLLFFLLILEKGHAVGVCECGAELAAGFLSVLNGCRATLPKTVLYEAVHTRNFHAEGGCDGSTEITVSGIPVFGVHIGAPGLVLNSAALCGSPGLPFVTCRQPVADESLYYKRHQRFVPTYALLDKEPLLDKPGRGPDPAR